LLSKEFVGEQKKKLESRLKEVGEEIEYVGERTADGHWRPRFVDWGDDAASGNIGDEWTETAGEQAQFEERLAVLKSLLNIKTNIENALERIDSGTYGRCSNCDRFIERERLEVIPEADTCIKCQD